jgi:hypothetical protein
MGHFKMKVLSEFFSVWIILIDLFLNIPADWRYQLQNHMAAVSAELLFCKAIFTIIL